MHLRTILGFAYDKELMDYIPLLKIDRSDRTAVTGDTYDNEEIKKIFAHANPSLALRIEMMVTIGMRSGEVRQLKWEYIDFKKGMIHLPQGIVKTRDGRDFPVSPRVLQKLNAMDKNVSPFVFPHKSDPNSPMERSDSSWQRLRRDLGITKKLHWFRHTAATRLVQGGIDPLTVQKALGMSDQVMKRVYFHVNEKDLKKMSHIVTDSLNEESIVEDTKKS